MTLRAAPLARLKLHQLANAAALLPAAAARTRSRQLKAWTALRQRRLHNTSVILSRGGLQLQIRPPHQLAVAAPLATGIVMMPNGNTSSGTQSRGHANHSHGHHHHHDMTYLTSGNKNDPGVKITRVGLYVNLGMAIVKGAGGYFFNSQA